LQDSFCRIFKTPGPLQVLAVKKEIIEKFNEELSKPGAHIIDFDFTKSEPASSMDSKNMGLIGDEIINQFPESEIVLIFSNTINGKPVMLFQASKSLVKKGFDCSAIAREAGKILKGGGGGKAEFAQVGGSDASALRNAEGKSKSLAIEKISAISQL